MTLQLRLIRLETDERRTMGAVFVDNRWMCYALEDSDELSASSHGCIPAGRYEITLYPSPRFNCEVLLLLHVPGRDMIEIHPGNTEADTEGCILPGMSRTGDAVVESLSAFKLLREHVRRAKAAGLSVFLTIENNY